MSDTQYPFSSPQTHEDWKPEIDPDLIEAEAPEGFKHSMLGVVGRLDEEGYRQSDERVLTQEERDRATAEILGMHVVDDPRYLTASGRPQVDLIGTYDAELQRIADSLLPKLPKQPDMPLGPEIDTPDF